MKGIAAWILVIGSVILGISVFFISSTLLVKQIHVAQKQSVIGSLSDLHGKLKTTCVSGGIGQLYHYKISLPDVVRAVYVTNVSDKLPPDKVSVLISDHESNVGNYFCFQFFDENLPRCLDIECQTKFTYIGSPSLKNDLATLIARLKGDEPVYKYYVFINKSDEHFLNTKGIQMIGDEIPPIVEEPSETTTTLPSGATTTMPPGVTTTSTTSTSSTTTTIPVKLTILIVPMNWDGSYSSYNSAADNQANKFLENIPLKNCPEKYRYLKADGSTNYGSDWENWYCRVQTNGQNCYVWDYALQKILDCANQFKNTNSQDYDFIVGIDDSNIAASNTWGGSCEYNVLGWSDGQGNLPSVIAESSEVIVATHELGHEFGLNDEYVDACRCGYGLVDPNANCLNPALDGDDPVQGYTSDYCGGGNLCPSQYTITCLGNKNALGGRCIMSYGNAPGPRAFSQESINHLSKFSVLNC